MLIEINHISVALLPPDALFSSCLLFWFLVHSFSMHALPAYSTMVSLTSFGGEELPCFTNAASEALWRERAVLVGSLSQIWTQKPIPRSLVMHCLTQSILSCTDIRNTEQHAQGNSQEVASSLSSVPWITERNRSCRVKTKALTFYFSDHSGLIEAERKILVSHRGGVCAETRFEHVLLWESTQTTLEQAGTGKMMKRWYLFIYNLWYLFICNLFSVEVWDLELIRTSQFVLFIGLTQ